MVGGNWLILGGGGFVVVLGLGGGGVPIWWVVYGWWWGFDLVGGLWVVALVLVVSFEFIYLFVYFICMSFFRLFYVLEKKKTSDAGKL